MTVKTVPHQQALLSLKSPRRISSRKLNILNGLFDMDLNLFDIDEQDSSDDQFVGSLFFKTFDNSKRTLSGPLK